MCLKHASNHFLFFGLSPASSAVVTSFLVEVSAKLIELTSSASSGADIQNSASVSSSFFMFSSHEISSTEIDCTSCGAYSEETRSSDEARRAAEMLGSASKMLFEGSERSEDKSIDMCAWSWVVQHSEAYT
jgi:hypothetical protein